MGIFDEYGIDADSIKESSFDIEDGTYYFEVAEAEIQEGTQNKPDTTFFYIDYQLTDEDGDTAGSTRSWYTMAEDGDSDTKRVNQSLGFFKADLKKLGVTDLANFDGSEIIGLKGVLQLKSTPGKGANRDKTYQNIRNLRLSEEEEAPAPVVKKALAKKAAPASTTKADAEAKARVKAKQAERAAAEAAEEPEEADDDNPFG